MADTPFMIEKRALALWKGVGRNEGISRQQTKARAVPVPEVGSNEPFWEGQTWRRKVSQSGLG